MNELKTLLGECVLKDVYFVGSVGSRYSVQDLLAETMSLKSLNTMWKNLKKTLADVSENSLFDNPSTSKVSELKLKIETVEAIFKYKKDLVEQAKRKAEEKEDAKRKLALLKNIKDEKELKKMGKMSLEKIEEEISSLEN